MGQVYLYTYLYLEVYFELYKNFAKIIYQLLNKSVFYLKTKFQIVYIILGTFGSPKNDFRVLFLALFRVFGSNYRYKLYILMI